MISPRFELASAADVSAPVPRFVASVNRDYLRIRVAGFDFATEPGAVGIRGEVAAFGERNAEALDRLVYTFGVERSWRDWFLVVMSPKSGLPMSAPSRVSVGCDPRDA
jgi:hypothetical protein